MADLTLRFRRRIFLVPLCSAFLLLASTSVAYAAGCPCGITPEKSDAAVTGATVAAVLTATGAAIYGRDPRTEDENPCRAKLGSLNSRASTIREALLIGDVEKANGLLTSYNSDCDAWIAECGEDIADRPERFGSRASAGYGPASATGAVTPDCADAMGRFNSLGDQRRDARNRLEGGLSALSNAYRELRDSARDEAELEYDRNVAIGLLGGAGLVAGAAAAVPLAKAGAAYAATGAMHLRTAQQLQGLIAVGYETAETVAAAQAANAAAQAAFASAAAAQQSAGAALAAGASPGLLATLKAWWDGGLNDYRAARARNEQMVQQLESACRQAEETIKRLEGEMDTLRPRLGVCGIAVAALAETPMHDWPSRGPTGIRG